MTELKKEFNNLNTKYRYNTGNKEVIIKNMRENLIKRNDGIESITIQDFDENNQEISRKINISVSEYQDLLRVDGFLFNKECTENNKQINDTAREEQMKRNIFRK